jgi:hypothetical protein
MLLATRLSRYRLEIGSQEGAFTLDSCHHQYRTCVFTVYSVHFLLLCALYFTLCTFFYSVHCLLRCALSFTLCSVFCSVHLLEFEVY